MFRTTLIKEAFRYSTNMCIKRLYECETATEMLLVRESYQGIESLAFGIADLMKKQEPVFADLLLETIEEKRDDFRTAFSVKENELIEGKK